MHWDLYLPIAGHTASIFLLLGLFLVRQVWQSRRSIPAGPAPLSDADKARLEEIIGQFIFSKAEEASGG